MSGLFDKTLQSFEQQQSDEQARRQREQICEQQRRERKFGRALTLLREDSRQYRQIQSELTQIWEQAGGNAIKRSNGQAPMIGVRLGRRSEAGRNEGMLLDTRLRMGLVIQMDAIRYEEITSEERTRLEAVSGKKNPAILQVPYGDGHATFGFRIPHIGARGLPEEPLIRSVDDLFLDAIVMGSRDRDTKSNIKTGRQLIAGAIGEFAVPIIAQLQAGLRDYPLEQSQPTDAITE